jgi:lipooligosaccharide transport system permease protein
VTAPVVAVLEHHLIGFRRTWRGSVFSSFVLPVLFFVSMGLTVGAYVDRTGSLGVRYVDYIAPGVLASTALQVAVGESTWPVHSAFQWSRIYHAMRASPLRVGDVLAGHLGYVLLRVLLSAAGFLLVMAAFGTVRTPWGLAALPVAVLVGLATAAPVFAFAASISSDSMFAVLLRFAVLPMTLFAGVFFPVESLPVAARVLAYASPLWHGVELCRAATLGPATAGTDALALTGNLGYLALWAVAGFLLARRRFARRLTD